MNIIQRFFNDWKIIERLKNSWKALKNHWKSIESRVEKGHEKGHEHEIVEYFQRSLRHHNKHINELIDTSMVSNER